MNGELLVKRRRIPEIDLLRGIALCLMMFHHTIGDLYDIHGVEAVAFQYDYWFYQVGRPIVLAVFLGVSGISSRFSRNSMKRGIRMVLFSIAATALTIFVDGLIDVGIILFNVIHVVALSTVVYAAVEKWAERQEWIPRQFPRPQDKPKETVYQPHYFTGVLIILGSIGIFIAPMIEPVLPQWSNNPFLIMLGSAANAHVLDQMPLFPWLGCFLIGAAIGHTLYAPGLPLAKEEGLFYRLTRPIRFLGRHSLWVYFAHQPIILFTLWLLGKAGIFG